MQNNVSKVCTCDYVNMKARADMFNADTICNEVNDSVHKLSAIIELGSGIYCFCVLTQHSQEEKEYQIKQLTEKHMQQIITNHTFLNLLTTTIVAPPSNASKWQMAFNSAFKGLK